MHRDRGFLYNFFSWGEIVTFFQEESNEKYRENVKSVESSVIDQKWRFVSCIMELQNERHIWSVLTPEGGADRLHTRDFSLNFNKKRVSLRDFVPLCFKT